MTDQQPGLPDKFKRKRRLAQTWVEVANRLSRMSCCERGQHACIITDARLRVLSSGYNGPAAGLRNGCRRPDVSGNCGCVHAEANAITQLAAREAFYAFLTGAPCEMCAQLLVNVGIKAVIFGTGTKSYYAGGKQILTEAGIVQSGFVDVVELFDRDGERMPW